MNMFLVYCDLQPESRSAAPISEKLNKFQGVRFQPYAWIILSESTSDDIHEKISKHLSHGEYVMITRMEEDYSCKQPENIRRWIRKHAMPHPENNYPLNSC